MMSNINLLFAYIRMVLYIEKLGILAVRKL